MSIEAVIQTASLIGSVESKANIVANIGVNACVYGVVAASPSSLSADVLVGKTEIIHTDLPNYEGSYEVTPNAGPQTLNTENKTLRSDMTIKPIPYYDVANEYGRTIYIGGGANG